MDGNSDTQVQLALQDIWGYTVLALIAIFVPPGD
jgi:hypothetical protein